MVDRGGYTYFQAGKKLGLSPSTAKMIVLKYKNSGKIFENKKDKIKRLKRRKNTQTKIKKTEIEMKPQQRLNTSEC